MSFGSVIAAISTPPGKGGVALIRVSGEGAIEICDRVFFPRSGKRLSECTPRMQVYGDVRDGETPIDDGLATVFRAPRSYTGEDVVEISCHGGVLVSARVLTTLLKCGAKAAERGEFTERAFINGRLSLSDAEAIGNLLEARSEAQTRLAAYDSRQRTAEATAGLRGMIRRILASLLARIDYPEEDLGELSDGEIADSLREILSVCERLLSTYSTAKAINEGVRCVIVGKPNVGKSSLYNALLCEDAAIVTSVKGTTRDVLTSSIPLGRVMLTISDTAGIHGADTDPVERIGIERSLKAIGEAELIIAVFDGSEEADGEDLEILSILSDLKVPKIAVINKSDLGMRLDETLLSGFTETVGVSAENAAEEARERLCEICERLFTDGDIDVGRDAIISSARQHAALAIATEHIRTAGLSLARGEFEDAIASELELALGAIGEIDGHSVAEEVVGEIFSRFCVGK